MGRDLIIRIVSDVALLGALGVVLQYLSVRWLSRAIDHRFQVALATETARLDLAKHEELQQLETRRAVYPEMAELVYRLRDGVRSRAAAALQCVQDPQAPAPRRLGPELHVLQENLFKYRIFVDDDVFDQLHAFKHACEDAQVLLHRITRPDTAASLAEAQAALQSRCRDSLPELEAAHAAVDRLLPEIVGGIKRRMQTVLAHP
ncbi:MAG: hypothetical protein R3E98_16970 [Gemmatimonadota bacterium]